MNPFTDCKIVGDNIQPEVYLRQEPGIQRGNPAMVMSRSSLMDFMACPHRWLTSPDKDSEAMEWGSLIDTIALSPGSFAKKYKVAPATYTSDKGEEKDWNYNAKFCKNWRDDKKAQGFDVIKQSEFDEAQAALTAIESNDFVIEVLKNSRKQVMVIGQYVDETTKLVIPLKCLIDIEPNIGSEWERYLSDFKTTASAHPRLFEKSVFNFNYDAQGFMFMELHNAATGIKEGQPGYRDSFQWIIQESSAPFEVPTIHPAMYAYGDFYEIGKAKVLRALKLYCRCLKTGVWPSYDPAPRVLIGGHSYIAQPEPWMLKATVEGMAAFVEPPEPDRTSQPATGPEMPEIGIIP